MPKWSTCEAVTEIERLEGTGIVPHYLAGASPGVDYMAKTYHLPQEAALAAHLAKGVRQRRADQRHLGSGVVQEVGVVVGLEVGVDRDRDRAQLDGAEEGACEVGAVQNRHEDAVLHLDAQLAQRVAPTVGGFGDLAVGVVAVLGADRHLAGAAGFQVGVQEVSGGVVSIGQLDHESSVPKG